MRSILFFTRIFAMNYFFLSRTRRKNGTFT
jgi:preprotein translocase subunit YajC